LSTCARKDAISARRSAFSVCNAKIFAGVGGTGTITREGGDCRDDDVGSAVVDAEKEDGEAYGGESDVCDWTSGDDTVGEDRFEADLAGHVVSLALSLVAGLSSLGRRAPPLPVSIEDTDLIADTAVDPEGDDTAALRESRLELPTAALPEAAIAIDVDDGTEGFVSVRVEDSLDDGELEGAFVRCDVSDEVRERFGRGTFGSGSVGGGELAPDPIRLACDEVGTTAVDGDFKRFEGDVADSAVAVIDCTKAPVEVDAVK
jgi:hypothetical protein